MNRFTRNGLLLLSLCVGATTACAKSDDGSKIVHDAEYYVLKAQHGDKWATEDKEIDKKLAALRKKHGKPPNIIHIMWDDTAVGELGVPHNQKNRGFQTPNINQFAAEGQYFSRMYTEPSCTPSRAAFMTGRHAVRSGMYNVSFPIEYGGMSEKEVTIGEVMSEAGYATAFYGKGHLGDIEESYMTNMGFDEAFWAPYNQVPSLYVARGQLAALFPTSIMPELYPDDPYDIDKGWRPKGYVWMLEGTKGGPVREWGTPPNEDDYYAIEAEAQKRTINFIRKSVKADKPFFISYQPTVASFMGLKPGDPKLTVSAGLTQEFFARLDLWIPKLLQELKDQGVEENTLVILMADNGPMTHNGPPGMVETLYRGGKGDAWEGAVRVTFLARWPSVIESNQIVGDIVHITDLYTTFANLAGAKKHIPTDRIVDGVDQTALFLNGDTHSRRDSVQIYTGDILAATVKGRFKRRWVGELPGLSGAAFYDLYDDPREVQPKMLPGFTTKPMFDLMFARHMLWKKKYPDTKHVRGLPLTGLENPRPDVLKATKPRINAEDVPFDPTEFLDFEIPYNVNMENWGSAGR
ncbi:MAG: sulfatase-like hydrolase/transferase [Pseudomonadales bacterium]|nr:sulfatase-like hydrolase/transferase [Pseudomonadales bacterium]